MLALRFQCLFLLEISRFIHCSKHLLIQVESYNIPTRELRFYPEMLPVRDKVNRVEASRNLLTTLKQMTTN
jgi:hypothetical protein